MLNGFGDTNRNDGVNRNSNRNSKNFDRQGFKQKLSGKLSYEELTGEAGSGDQRKKKVEKPSALIKEQSKRNKGLFDSILSMFHGDDIDIKERKMTISSRKTVEEIKKQLDKLYDRIKEYEDKLESKSKEISSKLVDLSKKVSKLSREITKSQRRIIMFDKQVKGYKADLYKLYKTEGIDTVSIKQTVIDGKIKELNFKIKDLNFKIQEEQRKIKDCESELESLTSQKDSFDAKKSKIKESLATLKKKSVAIDQKLGRCPVTKESTFEILRRSIRENARLREMEPSQASNSNRAFRTTWNSKTYSFGNSEALRDLSIKGLNFKGLDLRRPQLNWLEQRLKRAEQNGFSITPSNENERDNKEHGGKDNPDR